MPAWDQKWIYKTGSSCETAGKGAKSLPLPHDVEDPAIVAVSRLSVRDDNRSSIGAWQGEGKGWRFSGPASWGWPSIALRLSRLPPSLPLPIHPRRFEWAIPALSTHCQEAAMGVRRRPGMASGAATDRPLPRTPSGDPTPIMPIVVRQIKLWTNQIQFTLCILRKMLL